MSSSSSSESASSLRLAKMSAMPRPSAEEVRDRPAASRASQLRSARLPPRARPAASARRRQRLSRPAFGLWSSASLKLASSGADATNACWSECALVLRRLRSRRLEGRGRRRGAADPLPSSFETRRHGGAPEQAARPTRAFAVSSSPRSAQRASPRLVRSRRALELRAMTPEENSKRGCSIATG